MAYHCQYRRGRRYLAALVLQGEMVATVELVGAHAPLPGEVIRILRTELRVPKKVSVRRVAGVHVSVAPQQLIGMASKRWAAEQPRQ